MSHTINIQDHSNDFIHSKDFVQYTDDHFINKLNMELENMRTTSSLRINNIIQSESNSPISMSDSDSDDCFEHGDLHIYSAPEVIDNCDDGYSKPVLKKLTFRDVQSSIDKYYDTNERTSNELDVLGAFLKGRKHMYTKAAMITHFKTYLLLAPASAGSILVIIFWIFAREYYIYLSFLNVFVFVLYFCNIFFQWNSSAAIYLFWASQYDRIYQNSFIETETDKDQVLIILQRIEEKLRELGDCVIPWEYRYLFPILSNIRLFTFIKRIEMYKKNLIMKFKDIKNELRYIQWKWGENMSPREKSRFQFLCYIKEKIKVEILHYKNAYGEMERFILKEIQLSERWFVWYKKKYISGNPVLISYFSTIFADD